MLIAAVGLVLWRRKPRLARWLAFGSLALLWLLSTPVVAGLLLRAHQVDTALDPDTAPRAGAIVVLSADLSIATPEASTQTRAPPSRASRMASANCETPS